jgi:DNA-binding transcriptional MerR regulator
MAFPIFGKKEPERMASAGKGYVPIDRIKDLSSKGFSEPDMIDVLRKEGFSADEIDKALTEALKSGVSGISPPSTQPSVSLPTLEQIQPPQQQVVQIPQIPETSLPEQYYQQEYAPEEFVEYLVKERMSEANEKINEFMIRYEELEKRMNEVYEQMNALSKMKSTSEELILSKIEEFKDVVSDVDIRLSSLEKAFKETLPALIEAVRTLSDLVQRVRKES